MNNSRNSRHFVAMLLAALALGLTVPVVATPAVAVPAMATPAAAPGICDVAPWFPGCPK